MTSWRPPGSILEAPGLDFGGSWVDFSEIFGKKNHKRQKPAKKGHRSQICQTAKGGWAAVVPPPGGFNPPPTEGVRSVRDHQPHRFQDTLDPSQLANLKGQAHYAGLGS